MFNKINKMILPVATGVTIGLTVMVTSGLIGSTVGVIISGSFVPMVGYLIGDTLVVGISLCAITGLGYLSYKQDNHNEDISSIEAADNIAVSEIIEKTVNDNPTECEIVIQGETFENVDFH